jgi:sterol desaturase/sphingolipid hydroxylase (fatty acid hydroxylase superfamily)
LNSLRKFILRTAFIASVTLVAIGVSMKVIRSEKTVVEIMEEIFVTTGFLNFTFQSFVYSLLLVLSAVVIEYFAVGMDKSTLQRLIRFNSKSLHSDLFNWLLIHLGIVNFLFFLSTFGIFHYLSALIFNGINIRVDHYISNHTLLACLVFIIGDLKNYVFHRIMHIRPFWELHSFHHSAIEFNVFTATRTHFLQKMILILLDSIMFALFQIPITIFFGVTLFYQLLQYMHHSEVNWTFGWFGKWVILSPQAHRIHHSAAPEHYGKNFGSFFVIWDRLFGTFYSTSDTIHIGIPNNPYNQKGYLFDMWIGFKRFLIEGLKLVKLK